VDAEIDLKKLAQDQGAENCYLSPMAWKNLKPSRRGDSYHKLESLYIRYISSFSWTFLGKKNMYINFETKRLRKNVSWTCDGTFWKIHQESHWSNEPSPQVMWISIELSYLVAGDQASKNFFLNC